MLVPLLILVAGQGKPAPVVPPGCSTFFNQIVFQIEEKLEASDFAAAERLAVLLPERKVAVWWDDSKVPARLREEYAQARDKAFRSISEQLPNVSFAVGAAQAGLKISFAESLPAASEGTDPQAAVFMTSTSPSEPRVEAVISLKRGNPPHQAEAAAIQSEIQFALGTYFGLGEMKMPGGMMFRSNETWMAINRISSRDLKLVQTTLKISDELREAIKAKRSIPAGKPELQLQPMKLKLEPVLQGTQVPFSLQASNQGTGVLQVQIQPDCSCVMTTPFLQIKPGESALIKGVIDTTAFFGDLKKGLIVMSNDVDYPIREIPVEFRVEPRYRLIVPSGPILLMQDGGASVDVYLVTPEGKSMELTEVRLDGLPGEVTHEPWSGDLADPEMNEPVRKRQGYKFTVKLRDALPPGRASATLMIGTKDELFPVLRQNIAAQKGIVALPDQVWLGEVGRGLKRTVFLLSRPQIGFAITKIESDNKAVTAKHQPARGEWEHKITVEYDGNADFGNLEAVLTIHTNDPKQPKILVPVRGIVR